MEKSSTLSSSSSAHQSNLRIPVSTIKSGSDSDDSQIISPKRYTKGEVPFLPEEIIFRILLCVPAKVLHDVMRTVCRSWRKVIHDPTFIKAHRSGSTTSPFCLFIDDFSLKIYSLNSDDTTWKFSKTVNQVYLAHGDGFILTANCDDNSILYLVNPLTKQIISLPRLPRSSRANSTNCAVACSPLTLTYKVVVSNLPKIYILAVGDDKEWRKVVGGLDLSPEDICRPRTFGHHGLIYWYDTHTCHYLIALDVEKEDFHEVFIPNEVPECMRKMCLGTSLAVSRWDSSGFWGLVDFKNGGRWTKFGIVDFSSHKQEIIEIVGVHNKAPICGYNIRPVVVLSRDVVIFKFDLYFLAYNFKTGKFSRSFDYLPRCSLEWELMIDNSLVVL